MSCHKFSFYSNIDWDTDSEYCDLYEAIKLQPEIAHAELFEESFNVSTLDGLVKTNMWLRVYVLTHSPYQWEENVRNKAEEIKRKREKQK